MQGNIQAENIGFIYDDEQVKELQPQLTSHIKECQSHLNEVNASIDQYNKLLEQITAKKQHADQIISSQSNPDKSDTKSQLAPLDVSCQTITGRRSGNEDEELASLIKVNDQPRYQLFAVFDGHGGSDASHFCKENFQQQLFASQFLQQNLPNQALQEAFVSTDAAFCGMDGCKPQVGTTAAALLIDLKSKALYAANAGDARVVVKSNSQLFATIDHKPSDEHEKQRLKEKFGTEVYDFGGVSRVNGSLAVSRAIGDSDFKIYGVLPLPQIYEIKIKLDEINYIVVACDGLFDILQNSEICWILNELLGFKEECKFDVDAKRQKALVEAAKLYYNGKAKEGDQILKQYDDNAEPATDTSVDITRTDQAGKCAQILVRIAYVLGSTDNITCIVALKAK